MRFKPDFSGAHPMIKFPHTCSATTVSFLDVQVTLRDGRIVPTYTAN